MIARLCLQQGHIRGYFDGLRRRPDPQFAIDRREPDLQRDRAADQLFKALLGEGDLVASGHDRGRIVQTVLIGGEILRYASIHVQDCDRHPGNQGSRTVGYRTANVAGVCALPKASPTSKNQKEGQDPPPQVRHGTASRIVDPTQDNANQLIEFN